MYLKKQVLGVGWKEVNSNRWCQYARTCTAVGIVRGFSPLYALQQNRPAAYDFQILSSASRFSAVCCGEVILPSRDSMRILASEYLNFAPQLQHTRYVCLSMVKTRLRFRWWQPKRKLIMASSISISCSLALGLLRTNLIHCP